MSFKNSTLLLISLTFVFIILFYYELNHIEYNSKPTPTEFITKKKKRKELKKSRKEWMENMHKSHPDDNWRLIDKQNRKINTDSRNCSASVIKDINQELFKRFYKPIFIPIIAVVCSFLLILPKNNSKYKFQSKLTFLFGFCLLVFSETALRYSTASIFSSLLYIVAPWIIFLLAYCLFYLKVKNV